MLCMSLSASAQQVQSMKLLTPQIGWVLNGQHLYWTTDNGAHWKDITPPKAPKEDVGGVFFLDKSTGRVVLSYSDEKDEQQFKMAATHDSGASWTTSPIKLPWKRYAQDFAGGGNLFFLDEAHGWVDLGILSGSAFAPARLLATDDGGRTWVPTPSDTGKMGSLYFFSSNDGVLAGGPGNSELHVTHDGSLSWKELDLKAPPGAAPADFPTYGEPICQDAQHGFLPVTYSGRDGEPSALVLFATEDSGRTWRADRTLPGLEERSPGQAVAATVVSSLLIAAPRAANGKVIEFTTLPAHGRSTKTEIDMAGFGQVLQLSFVNDSTGWASTWTGLFSTTDGGFTWKRISIAFSDPAR